MAHNPTDTGPGDFFSPGWHTALLFRCDLQASVCKRKLRERESLGEEDKMFRGPFSWLGILRAVRRLQPVYPMEDYNPVKMMTIPYQSEMGLTESVWAPAQHLQVHRYEAKRPELRDHLTLQCDLASPQGANQQPPIPEVFLSLDHLLHSLSVE